MAVGGHHGREPVRDHQRGAALHQIVERLLHRRLRLGVELRGRFVEDQDRRVLEQRARDGETLALPARELLARLADDVVVALRQRHDELVGVGRGGGLAHPFERHLAATVGDVVAHGVVEEDRLLRHQAHQRAQVRERQVTDVDAVDRDRPLLGVEEARQQIHHRRLAGARRSHQRDRLPPPRSNYCFWQSISDGKQLVKQYDKFNSNTFVDYLKHVQEKIW